MTARRPDVAGVIMHEAKALRRECIRKGVPERDVDDLLQDAAIILHTAVIEGRVMLPDDPGAFVALVRSYLRGTTVNLSRSRVRKRAFEVLTAEMPETPAPDRIAAFHAADELRVLKRTMTRAELQIVLALAQRDTLEGAAEKLGIPFGTLATRLLRMRKRLIAALRRDLIRNRRRLARRGFAAALAREDAKTG